jgi:hypothetical protein
MLETDAVCSWPTRQSAFSLLHAGSLHGMMRSSETSIDFHLNIWRLIPELLICHAAPRHLIPSTPEAVLRSYYNYTAVILLLEAQWPRDRMSMPTLFTALLRALGVHFIARNFICTHQETYTEEKGSRKSNDANK